MIAKTHMLGGAAAGLGVATLTHLDPILLAGAGVLGGLLPDICHTGSTIGRKLPLLSNVVSFIFGHRTFTHSLVFLILAAWLMAWLPLHTAIVYGILAGMASHLLLDALTKNGIKLLWPLKITVRSPITIKTGGAWEPVVSIVLIGLCIFWAVDIFELVK